MPASVRMPRKSSSSVGSSSSVAGESQLKLAAFSRTGPRHRDTVLLAPLSSRSRTAAELVIVEPSSPVSSTILNSVVSSRRPLPREDPIRAREHNKQIHARLINRISPPTIGSDRNGSPGVSISASESRPRAASPRNPHRTRIDHAAQCALSDRSTPSTCGRRFHKGARPTEIVQRQRDRTEFIRVAIISSFNS